MSLSFFVCDAHLGVSESDEEKCKETLLLDFFEYVLTNGKRLFLVGDIFDFWMEYKSVIPRNHFSVLYALRKLVIGGVEVHFLAGNHDFWTDGFLQNEVGLRVHSDAVSILIDGRRYFIAHGDGIAKKDPGYRFLKKTLRHPLNFKLYKLFHPAAGIFLAHQFSRFSRKHELMEHDDRDYIEFARERFLEGFSGVIMGHTHRPLKVIEGDHTYINIGDWMTHFSYGRLKDDNLSLEYWKK